MTPTPAPPANVLADLQTLANDLANVDSAQAAVASATSTLTGDQTALAAAQTSLTAAQATANTDLSTLLSDIAAWDAGPTPPPAVTTFKAKVTSLAAKHRSSKGASNKGAFNWQTLLALAQELLPLIASLLGGLTPTPAPGHIKP